MRHCAGSWSPPRAVANTVGAATPRPCVRVFRIIAALVLAAHAGFIAMAWHTATAKPQPPRQSRIALTLVAPKVQPGVRDMRAVVAEAKRPAALKPRPVVKDPPKVQPPKPPEPPVTGVAFAPAAIAMPSPARWMQPPPQPAPPMMPPPVHMAQAQAAQAQLTEALYRQLADAPAALVGECRLHAEPQAPLDCDRDEMKQALESRVAALAAWLAAYRSVDARVNGLTIALADGRFQPTLVRAP